MTHAELTRWGGLAGAVGGALILLSVVLLAVLTPSNDFPQQAASPVFVPLMTMNLFGAILMLLGLVALYLFQPLESGILGLVGFLLAFIGTALAVGALFTTYAAAALAKTAPNFLEGDPPAPLIQAFIAQSIIFGVGLIVFGMALLRVRRLPRWGAVLLMIGGAISIVEMPLNLPPIGEVLFSLGLMWLGYALWARTRADARFVP